VSTAVVLFLSRLVLLGLLYGFLYTVIRALRRDLRAIARPTPPQSAADAVPVRGPATLQPAPAASSPAPVPLTARAAATPRGVGLEVVETGQTTLARGCRIALRDPFLIGRSASNDLALEDDWVSAQHLRLRRQNGTWVAEDVGSTNGTSLNDRRLNGMTRIREGDRLQVGRVVLSLVDDL